MAAAKIPCPPIDAEVIDAEVIDAEVIDAELFEAEILELEEVTDSPPEPAFTVPEPVFLLPGEPGPKPDSEIFVPTPVLGGTIAKPAKNGRPPLKITYVRPGEKSPLVR